MPSRRTVLGSIGTVVPLAACSGSDGSRTSRVAGSGSPSWMAHADGVDLTESGTVQRRPLGRTGEIVSFDTVQLPLNVLDAHYESFEQRVLPELVRRGIGVLGIRRSPAARL